MPNKHSQKDLLPDEIVLAVFQFLTLSTVQLCKLELVCKQFSRLSADDSHWVPFFSKKYSQLHHRFSNNYRFLFLELCAYERENDRLFYIPVSIIGPSCAGKTTSMIQYITRKYDNFDPTIDDSATKIVKIDDYCVTVEIFDRITHVNDLSCPDYSHLRNSRGFIIMYSITDYNAFESVPEYMDKIRQYCSKADVPILLVGNKTDLESERCVTKEALKRFATENKIEGYEISNSNITQVDSVFDRLIQNVWLSFDLEKILTNLEQGKSLRLKEISNQKKKCSTM